MAARWKQSFMFCGGVGQMLVCELVSSGRDQKGLGGGGLNQDFLFTGGEFFVYFMR
jgi:hypothetical protein